MQSAQRGAASAWQPVLPSHELRPAENIVAGFAGSEELALWRSREGVVQAWENRCPHRGTRLTLGRIVEGRLACAYHGWEFDAASARCSAIPALPQGPVPRNLCVKTYRCAEALGMVWVAAPDPADVPPEPTGPTGFFCRSLAVRAPVLDAAAVLQAQGLSDTGRFVWVGGPAQQALTLYLTDAHEQLVFLHAWLDRTPTPEPLKQVMGALRRLRGSIEAHCASGSVA